MTSHSSYRERFTKSRSHRLMSENFKNLKLSSSSCSSNRDKLPGNTSVNLPPVANQDGRLAVHTYSTRYQRSKSSYGAKNAKLPTSSSNISSNTDKSNGGIKNLKTSKARRRLQIPEDHNFSHSLPNMTKLYTGGLPCSKDEIIPGSANKKEPKSGRKAARSKKGVKPKAVRQVQKETKEETRKKCEKVDVELEERCRKWVAEVAREKFENPDQLFIPHLLVP